MLTPNDIGKLIQRPGEELQAAVDRLRNWTKEGLIRPIGNRHPGTGRKKQYAKSAATRALILQTLSDATGGRAVYLSGLIDVLEPELRKAQSQDTIFVISRKLGAGGRFEVTTWRAKDLGKAMLQSTADVHIVLNPQRILNVLKEDHGDG